jgi:hypothetical protein
MQLGVAFNSSRNYCNEPVKKRGKTNRKSAPLSPLLCGCLLVFAD